MSDSEAVDAEADLTSRRGSRGSRKNASRFRTLTSMHRVTHLATLTRPKRPKSCERSVSVTEDKSAKVAGIMASLPRRPDSGYDDVLMLPHHEPEPTSRNSRKASLVSNVSQQELMERYSTKAMSTLNELIRTEESYVHNLMEIVDGYLDYMEQSKKKNRPDGMIQMPMDLQTGKDRIIFGNIQDIYEYHLKIIQPELSKAMDDVNVLVTLFATKKDSLKKKYGKFCINKPKSEYIVSQHSDYFTLIRMAKNFEHNLNSHLMNPIQRVTRYPLLLRDIRDNFLKAGDADKGAIVAKAFDLANEVAEYANAMMTAGRIRGFQGDVTRQGLLLMSGNVTCFKKRGALTRRAKIRTCQMFVFQESVIICEKQEPNIHASIGSYPAQLYFWTSFQMNKLIIREVNRGGGGGGGGSGADSCPRFELERRDDGRREVLRPDELPSGSEEHLSKSALINCVMVQCETEARRDEWFKVISDQIRELNNIAITLTNPKAS